MTNLNLLRTEISNAERNGDATVVLTIEQARHVIRDAEAMHGGDHVIQEQQKVMRGLYQMSDAVIQASWDGGEYDGASIQEMAIEYGLLKEVSATESCGQNCSCVEHGFPIICYRKTYKTPSASVDKVASLLPGGE